MDVVGYSAKMNEDERGTTEKLKNARNIIEKLVKQGSGRIFNTAGDPFMLEFNSNINAVNTTTKIQKEVHLINSKFEFINTDDVANIIFNIINQKKYFNQIFNLSGDGQMSIKEIVDLFSRNKKKKIIFHKNKKLINYKINTNKIESIIKLPKTYNTIKTFFKINHDYNKNTN